MPDKQMAEWYTSATRRHAQALGWERIENPYERHWRCTGCGKVSYAVVPKKRHCPMKKKQSNW